MGKPWSGVLINFYEATNQLREQILFEAITTLLTLQRDFIDREPAVAIANEDHLLAVRRPLWPLVVSKVARQTRQSGTITIHHIPLLSQR